MQEPDIHNLYTNINTANMKATSSLHTSTALPHLHAV